MVYVCVCMYIYVHIIYICNEILLSYKKKTKIMSFAATWMDLDIFILSEKSQTDKDKYYMISLICEKIFFKWYN